MYFKCFNRVFRTDAFKSLCLQLEVVSSSHRIDTANNSTGLDTTNNTTRLEEVHDTSTGQNGDITITEEELNLFPSLIPKRERERQQSIRSSKSIKVSSTGKKFSRQRRPPVGSLGKLVRVNNIAQNNGLSQVIF